MNVCTIIAKNYLAYARVLARSFAEHHPDGRFWTLIIDDFSEYIDPELEPFEILTPQAVGCDQFTEMALSYSVLELSTAVKPWLLRHLMGETGGPVTYLDPDIKIFAPLDRLDELAARRGLVLTPHNTRPVPQDGRRPSQVDIMIAGIYNLGYVTLAPRAEIEGLLDWWADRLLRDCRVDPVWGYFVDQRWFDLAPGLLSELEILRDPEFNVAYWNLHSRGLERSGSEYLVDERPLAFFHFSGFDPEHPLVLSRHQDRVDVLAHPVLETLLGEYAQDLLEAGHAVSRRWPYGFAALGDGTHFDDMLRGLYDRFRIELEASGRPVPSLFELAGVRSFDAWMRSQEPGAAAGVNRALAYVYEKRTDLKAAFPNLQGAGGTGLLTWALAIGRNEVPLVARVVDDRDVLALSGDETREADSFEIVTSLRALEPRHPLREGPWGVNVIGQFSSEREGGKTARAVVRALDARRLAVAPVESPTTGAAHHEESYLTASLEDAAFPVNLICLSRRALFDFVREAGRETFAGRYSVGVWLAEEELAGGDLREQFSLVDEAWVPSTYAASAVGDDATVPVTIVPPPVHIPPFERQSHAALGLPGGKFLFLSSLDYSARGARANAAAVIEAFRALGRPEDAALILRCRGAEHDPEAHTSVVEAAAGGDITVIDRRLSPAEEYSIVAASDCLVSLHGAVNFGLVMAHAMWLGTPVIATGFSGNLDYMNESNCLLVQHHGTGGSSSDGAQVGGAHRVQPDIAHATVRMAQVLDDRPAARRLGIRAAEDIRRTNSPMVVGELMQRRLESIRATGRVRTAPGHGAEVPPDLATVSMRIQEGLGRRASPGPGRRVRGLARRVVLTALRPLTRSQHNVNTALVAALAEANASISELRREDAAKRATLLAQIRQYQLSANGGEPYDTGRDRD